MVRPSGWMIAAWLGSVVWASAAAADEPTPAMPLNNPGDWVTGADYPIAAVIDKLDGVVEFTLAIDSRGGVEACRVTQSSGKELLDSETCNLVTRRARFKPATDAQGQVTSGSYRNRVRWARPESDAKRVLTTADTVVIIETDGSIKTCRQSLNGGPYEPLPPGKGACGQKADISGNIFRDENGRPARILMRVESTVTIEPVW
jgi:TonB family protein